VKHIYIPQYRLCYQDVSAGSSSRPYETQREARPAAGDLGDCSHPCQFVAPTRSQVPGPLSRCCRRASLSLPSRSSACTSNTHLPPSVSLSFAAVHYAQDMIDLSLHHYPYSTTDVAAASTAATPISATQRPSVMQAAQTQASSSPAPTPVSKTSFAFLVHSQDTIPNNLPPDVDDKPLARQRRRRTRSVKSAWDLLFAAVMVLRVHVPRVPLTDRSPYQSRRPSHFRGRVRQEYQARQGRANKNR